MPRQVLLISYSLLTLTMSCICGLMPRLVLLLLAVPTAAEATLLGGLWVDGHRRQYEKPTVERLRHGDAEAFRFDRYQSPAAVKAAFDGCRSRRSFRTHEASDGRRGLVSSTRLGGDWVLAESEQLAPACTAEEVLRAYLTGSLQKEWNADKVSRVAFSRAASPERGRYYRQDIELRSVRVIRSRTGPMSYSQTISVDKVGGRHYCALVRLDPDCPATARLPFEAASRHLLGTFSAPSRHSPIGAQALRGALGVRRSAAGRAGRAHLRGGRLPCQPAGGAQLGCV